MVEKIYFDMDGVLADFDRGVEEICRVKSNKQESENPEADRLMWESISKTDHFYDRLEPMPGAIELFCFLFEKYGDRCQILSAVPKPHRNIPTAREDKINWVKRLLPEGVIINLVYRAEKQDFAKNRNCILIDDYQINIDEWTKSGGTGVLFETAELAKETLQKILGE